MKTFKTKLTNFLMIVCLLCIQGAIAQGNTTCENFNNNSVGNWQTSAASISVSLTAPSADGSRYLRGADGASSSGSWIYNTSYNSSSISECKAKICYDYKVFNDGDSSESHTMTPTLRIYRGTVTNQTAAAVFVANNAQITENSGWVNICAPLEPANGSTLPSNNQGYWVISGGGTAADWNNLLNNFDGIAFGTDVAGQPSQTERIGFDNFCVTNTADTPVAAFHFQDQNGTVKNTFDCNDTLFLNGTASQNEANHFIDIWRRPIGGTGSFQWQSTLGWTSGQAGLVNLTSLFNGQNYTIAGGYEYEVKLAVGNECNGWVPTTRRFIMEESEISSDFSIQRYCAEDGTITVVVTATDPNPAQWWRLFETNTAGTTSDANTIGGVSPIQGGTTVTYTGLSRSKNYYVKHGVWNNCTSWKETRKALPNTIGWNNYTTNFAIAASNDFNGNVTVNVQAANNPVFVNHWWGVFYDGTNTQVAGNGIQCCASDTATFNNNLQINTWYYIKHGIWNECTGWGEKRIAFRIQLQGRSRGEYYVETKEIPFRPTRAYLEEMNRRIATGEIAEIGAVLEESPIGEETIFSPKTIDETKVSVLPNPVQTQSRVIITTIDVKTVAKVELVSLSGERKEMKAIENKNGIEVQLDGVKQKGVNFIQIQLSNGEKITKRVIVK